MEDLELIVRIVRTRDTEIMEVDVQELWAGELGNSAGCLTYVIVKISAYCYYYYLSLHKAIRETTLYN